MPTSKHRKKHKVKAATFSNTLKQNRKKLMEVQKSEFLEKLKTMYDNQKHEEEVNNSPTIDVDSNTDLEIRDNITDITENSEIQTNEVVDTNIDL